MPLRQRALDRLVWDFVEQTHAAGQLAGVMLPMSFGKTTQFCYRAAFEIGRDPNVLASIVTDGVDNSAERVQLIRKILDRPEYAAVFPHVKVVAGRDEKQAFTIERDGLSKDPTCSGAGVLTGTGTRTNFLLMDDVVTLRNAIQEPQSRRRVLEAIRTTWMSRTKIAAEKAMRVAWIQTAYHQSDAAAVLREEPDSGWRWLDRPCRGAVRGARLGTLGIWRRRRHRHGRVPVPARKGPRPCAPDGADRGRPRPRQPCRLRRGVRVPAASTSRGPSRSRATATRRA